jgi:Cu(I)/Ag(I) efflux system membrane fusion protein
LVYVKTNPDEPVFEMREVTLGNKNGETFTILSGLQNGEEIVTNGTFTVDGAAQLQGKKSMMNQGKGGGKPIEPMTDMEMKLPETFQKNFEKAMAPYFEMKDAFIEGNPEKVLALAKATLKEIESIPASGLGTMEKSHFLKIPEILKAIIGNNNLENQRAHFVILNENMVAIAMNIKNFNSRWFVQKCPMANSNKGAVWLSREKEIRNPYYGEQMLTCGSVIRVIQ